MNHYHRLNNMEPPGRYFAMDFPLPLDCVKQAHAYGLDGVRAETPDELSRAIATAIDSGKPYVIDAVIDGAL